VQEQRVTILPPSFSSSQPFFIRAWTAYSHTAVSPHAQYAKPQASKHKKHSTRHCRPAAQPAPRMYYDYLHLDWPHPAGGILTAKTGVSTEIVRSCRGRGGIGRFSVADGGGLFLVGCKTVSLFIDRWDMVTQNHNLMMTISLGITMQRNDHMLLFLLSYCLPLSGPLKICSPPIPEYDFAGRIST